MTFSAKAYLWALKVSYMVEGQVMVFCTKSTNGKCR